MLEGILSHITVIDLDRLPENAVVCCQTKGRKVVISIGQLKKILSGKPGRGNRAARDEHDRKLSQAGCYLQHLFRAIDTADEDSVRKFTDQCSSLMGTEWTATKVAQRERDKRRRE